MAAAVPAPTGVGPHSLLPVLPWLTRSSSAHAAGIGLLAVLLGTVSAGPEPQAPQRPDQPSRAEVSVQQVSVLQAQVGLAADTRFGTVPPQSVPSAGLAPYDVHDPSTWSNAALAAELTVSCVDVNDVRRARQQARAGIGGITLIGSHPDRHLTQATRQGPPRGAARPRAVRDERRGGRRGAAAALEDLPVAVGQDDGRLAQASRAQDGEEVRRRGCAPSVSRWTSLRWPT